MPAEILTIGTELLLGDILDTNSRSIARCLRQAGVDLYRTTTVGDNSSRIAQAMREAMGRAEVVITTGGLGPTVDDPTREAAARAVGVEIEFHEELWQEIQERFARFGRKPTENNKRQAYLPAGAQAISNPVGTAPAFRIEHAGSVLIALPGVPAEMEWLLEHEVIPYLERRFGSTAPLEARVLHVAGVGESWVDEKIQDLEVMTHPTVGVLAHPGRIDIRIAAKASSCEEAREAIAQVEIELRRRLGPAVYGADDDRLEVVTMAAFARRGWRLAVVEAGTQGCLTSALADAGPGWTGAVSLPEVGAEPVAEVAARARSMLGGEALLYLGLAQTRRVAEVSVYLETPSWTDTWSRRYGGPAVNAAAWGVAIALDLARRRLEGE